MRRLSAEQFADAIRSITGEWSVYQPRVTSGGSGGGRGGPPMSDPATVGVYAREWQAASSNLTRALGRPIRDQVTSSRPTQSTTPQALELVNGEMLTRWLSRGARRMVGQLPPERLSLFNKTVAGRNATASKFDIDVSKASKLWLIAEDFGSNAPERVEPLLGGRGIRRRRREGDRARLVDARRRAGLRQPSSQAATDGGVRVRPPSRLVYDISGQGFTRFRGNALDNPRSEIGGTLNPAVRFFVFDVEPNMDRLLPPSPQPPLAPARRSPQSPRLSTGCSCTRSAARLSGRTETRGERHRRSGQTRTGVGRRTRRPVVGADDDARVSVDLLKDDDMPSDTSQNLTGLTAEERRIYARVSRRGFMGATAGATLAALAGREPALSELRRGKALAPRLRRGKRRGLTP